MDSANTAITFPPTLTEISLSLSLEQGGDWSFIGCFLEFSVDSHEYGLSGFHSDSRFKNSWLGRESDPHLRRWLFKGLLSAPAIIPLYHPAWVPVSPGCLLVEVVVSHIRGSDSFELEASEVCVGIGPTAKVFPIACLEKIVEGDGHAGVT